MTDAGSPDLGCDAIASALALQLSGEVRRNDVVPALLEDRHGVPVADRAGSARDDADPPRGQRQLQHALATQQTAGGELPLQVLPLHGDLPRTDRRPNDSVDLELQAAVRPAVLQIPADHDEVPDRNELGDGRLAQRLLQLLVVGPSKPGSQRDDRIAARLGQGEGDPDPATTYRRGSDDLAAEPHPVGEGGRQRTGDALLQLGDSNRRLVGAFNRYWAGCWHGALGSSVSQDPRPFW